MAPRVMLAASSSPPTRLAGISARAPAGPHTVNAPSTTIPTAPATGHERCATVKAPTGAASGSRDDGRVAARRSEAASALLVVPPDRIAPAPPARTPQVGRREDVVTV